MKESDDGKSVTKTVPRSKLWEAQTPQVFRRQDLAAAFAAHGGASATDEAEMMEQAGQTVHVVEGSPLNIKITTRRDLKLAAAILKSMPPPKLDGPIHPFADDHLWR